MRNYTVTWGIGCAQTHVLGDLVAAVQLSERAGFDYLWYGNEKLYPDMWVGLTAAALHSDRLRIGTFVADPYSIHPAVTAAMIATLDQYSGGRAVLLLGAGGSGLREIGMERRDPVGTLEQSIELIRGLLRGERVRSESPQLSADASLHFPARHDLPIWVATRGVRVMELGGRVADGVMIGTIARAQDIAPYLERVRAAAAAAGREPDMVTLSVRVDVSTGADGAAARNALRAFVAGFLSASYPDRGFVRRAGLEIPPDLEAVCATKDLQLAWRSGDLVPDEFVDAFTWSGTPEEVAERIAAVVDLGVDNVTLMFHDATGPVQQQVETFANEVVPRVSALLGADVFVSEKGQ